MMPGYYYTPAPGMPMPGMEDPHYYNPHAQIGAEGHPPAAAGGYTSYPPGLEPMGPEGHYGEYAEGVPIMERKPEEDLGLDTKIKMQKRVPDHIPEKSGRSWRGGRESHSGQAGGA